MVNTEIYFTFTETFAAQICQGPGNIVDIDQQARLESWKFVAQLLVSMAATGRHPLTALLMQLVDVVQCEQPMNTVDQEPITSYML